MSVFVDTSAFLSLLDASDRDHPAARTTWEAIVRRGEPLVVSSYILVETFALIQRRLGLEAVRVFQQNAVPLLQIVWVGETAHSLGVLALLAANRRQLSLVDCVSFALMRQLGINTVFAFDQHFVEQGFTCIP
jgi:predicted nucleic acid-binding protein